MKVKIYEGSSLEELIKKAKEDMGEIEILYYEVEREGFLPFFKRRKYKLFVSEKSNGENECVRSEIETEIKKEIDEIKELLLELKKEPLSRPSQPLPSTCVEPVNIEIEKEFEDFGGDALELLNLLLKKGVEKEVAREFVKRSCGLDIDTEKLDLNTLTFREALVNSIKEFIDFTGEFKVEEGKKVAYVFLGPTGVGKTTNLFKVASRFVLEKGLRVGVITTDTFKVGAVAQARSYASILDIPFFVATDNKKLKEIVDSLKDLDVILVDTVGRSHYDYWRLGEIKSILTGLDIPSQMVLLISCNYSTSEAVQIVNRYRSFFPISSLFFTKIDESSKPGILLNVPYLTGLPVSYISTGQRVPEDLKVLNPELVATYVLGE